VNPAGIKAVRAQTGLSQAEFAELLSVDLGTLRNWEQGRREPTGPAKALLRAIHRDPANVLKALAG
jgi:putative transcriptional regulator